jgi:hypothetical protein
MLYQYIIVNEEKIERTKGEAFPNDDFFQSQELLRLAKRKAWEGAEVVAVKEDGRKRTISKWRNFEVAMFNEQGELLADWVMDKEGHKDWLEETV